jgi:hypothetical protein
MFFFPVTSPVAFFLVIVAIIGHCRICSVPAFFVTMHTGLLSAVQPSIFSFRSTCWLSEFKGDSRFRFCVSG